MILSFAMVTALTELGLGALSSARFLRAGRQGLQSHHGKKFQNGKAACGLLVGAMEVMIDRRLLERPSWTCCFFIICSNNK